MAEFGAKHPCFKPEGAGAELVVIGKLVAANLTVTLASGELYADDELAEQVSEFASGSIAMETDDMTDENASVVYGCKVVEKILVDNVGDTAPTGRLGYYKVLMRNKKKFYKGFFYPRVKAALGNDNAQTRGSNITFQTTSTTFTVFADENGDWRKRQTFDKESEVLAWIESMVNGDTAPEQGDGA